MKEDAIPKTTQKKKIIFIHSTSTFPKYREVNLECVKSAPTCQKHFCTATPVPKWQKKPSLKTSSEYLSEPMPNKRLFFYLLQKCTLGLIKFLVTQDFYSPSLQRLMENSSLQLQKLTNICLVEDMKGIHTVIQCCLLH